MQATGNSLLTRAFESMPHIPEVAAEGSTDWTQMNPLRLLVDLELSTEEKETLLGILRESRLTPNVSVLDLLFFDLHEELGKLAKLIEKEVFEQVIADLERCYACFVLGQDQDTTRLQGFLKGMIAVLIRSNFALNSKAGGESQRVKAPGDTRLITQCLFGRVNLFRKLAELPNNRDFFSLPLSSLAANYNLAAVSADKMKNIFTCNSQFLSTIYNALLRVQPELKEFAQQYATMMNTICQASDPASPLYGKGVIAVTFTTVLLGDQSGSPYLNRLFRDGSIHYTDIAIKYFDLCRKYATHAADVKIQQGHVPSFMDRTFASKDKLAEFKANQLIESTFALTEEEAALLDEIFHYPLDSELTLFDLLGFAFFERMERLKCHSKELTAPITYTQGLLSSSFLRLWVGIHREFKGHTNAMGAINEYSKKFALFPKNASSWFDAILDTFRKNLQQINLKNKSQVLDQFTKRVIPLRNLLVHLLSSKGHYELLTKGASTYLGYDALDKGKNNADIISKYWHHLRCGFQVGCEEGFIGVNYDFKRILADDQFFTKKLIESERLSFGKKVGAAIFAFDQNSQLLLQSLNQAIAGTLSHADWCTNNGMQKVYKKNHQEFKEQLFSSFFLMGLLSAQITDFLRLVESRVYPSTTFKTSSCQYRMRYNMQLCKVKEKRNKSTVLPGAIQDNVHSLCKTIHSSFDQMDSVFHFNLTDPENMRSLFHYAKWMRQLAPHSRLIESTFAKTLTSLKVLKSEILEYYRTAWAPLSLEEIKQIRSQEIKEALFTEGLQLLRPLMVLSDMLVLLQQHRYSEEAAVIPQELADIMELDEIEALQAQLMREKTRKAQPPEEVPTAPMPQENKDELLSRVSVPQPQPVVPAAVSKSQLVKKNPAKSVDQSKDSQSRFSLPSVAKELVREDERLEDVKELEQMTKSREILSKLKGMGFFEMRQKGSHHILEGPEGGQVVVPNNRQIPAGTRHSIAEQAAAALQKK